jgi:hypothetical protein
MKSFKEFLAEASIVKASGADKAKGESYSVYDTTTNKIVITDDNKRLTGLKRKSAKALAQENSNYKVASDSWAFDHGIK